ncbi:MAG: HesA/MoeB/ThiF family protein [Bacteroidetes bacterium]|nr:HesA/MoeB/ThiF family protein [Bacteroidota bacterium]
MINKEEFKRYQKQILLEEIGLNGQLLLKKAKVAIVGAGGLGCPVLQYLTSCGVGTIGVIDFDTVDETNLHRQILYTANDIGKKKAEVAIEKLRIQNPYVNFIKHDVLLDETNAEIIFKEYDFIIDGCDNFATRYIVNDACVKLNKALVYGSILGFEAQLALFNLNGSKHLRDLYSEAPNPEDVPNCSENGVLGTFTGLVGTLMAQLTCNLILGINAPINELLIVNGKNFSIKHLKY